MTTLNGLTRPWDSFIQIVFVRKEKLKFDSLWEECVQEEERVANREAILLRNEDHVNFSKSQPSFSLVDFSAKFKCQTQF